MGRLAPLSHKEFRMLYKEEECEKIIVRIYEYLQQKVKKQPRTLKMDRPLHRKAVASFIELLPPTAGIEYLWDFFVFQFYVFAFQEQKIKVTPLWFMGKEALRRWEEYDGGARWHAREWAQSLRLENPVKFSRYEALTDDILLKERMRMSRISGPNFCELKYGPACYDPASSVCEGCPFEKDCMVLFGRKDANGENLFQRLDRTAQGQPSLVTHVNLLNSRVVNYAVGEDDEED